MLRGMAAAASAMVPRIRRQEVIANNLANVNTTGFKKSKVEFQDVLYEKVRRAGTNVSALGEHDRGATPTRSMPRQFRPPMKCRRSPTN